MSAFLTAHVPRQLLVRLPNGQEASRSFTFEEIKADFVPRSRSASPRKRKTTNLEEGQFTAKRTCRENDWGTNQLEGSYTATSLPSTCSPESPPQPSLSRQDWVRMRRPTNPSLYCCNYDKAESDARAGKPGKVEWGGAYLCEQCLGIEYADDRNKDVEVASWDD